MLDYGPTSLFNTFGYLHLPGFFGVDEVDRMSAEFDAVAPATGHYDDSTQKLPIAPWGMQDKLGLRLLTDERVADIPYKVLGHGSLLLYVRCRRLVEDLPWQGGGDLIPWPLQHITIAIVLDRAGAEDGCLRFVPCSHRNYLRLLDPRWQKAPDYLYGLRNPQLRWDHNALGVTDEQVPAFATPAEPGDVIVYTPDVLHAALGVTAPRRLIEITYIAEPRTDAQLYFLRQLDASSGDTFRMPPAIATDTAPAIREMVARWTELGFDPAQEVVTC